MKLILVLLILTLTPSTTFAAGLNGKQLYRKDCIACHGMDGSGQTKLGRSMKPNPAADLRPKILSRKEIRETIQYGQKKTGMHGHAKVFEPGEVEKLIDYILTFPYQATPAKGNLVFDKFCSRCHGADGLGKPSMHAPNLILSELSDIGMARIIRNGHEGSLMGSFKKELSNDEVEDLLAWLRLKRYGLECR